MNTSPQVLSVREVTSRIRRLLEQQIGQVWVEGECSNVSAPQSGHVYFTLKDETSQIQAAWFRGRRTVTDVLPRNGMKLRVKGRVTAYEKGSQFQILVESAEEAGLGDLRKRFDELKERLQKEGLFDKSAKRPLPLLPRKIGIVTSPTGAAIRDMLTVLNRRYSDRHVTIAPVPVQGDAAAASIARAIQFFDQQHPVDVILMGRGGGSLEDLWAFNEEVVARAIAAASTPIISAVGHETDFTISDFTADLRAPTPSAAAEVVVGPKQEFEHQVRRLNQRLHNALDQRRLYYRNRLSRLQGHKLFHEPAHLVQRHRQHVLRLQDRMQRSLLRRVTEPKRKVSENRLRLEHAVEQRFLEIQRRVDELADQQQRLVDQNLLRKKQQFTEASRQLQALNPYAVLRRGFSITRRADGRVIESIEGLTPGDELETLTREGRLISTLKNSETNSSSE